MNIKEFMNTKSYQDFIKNNPGKGNLKIRAYAASEALPVSGLRIVVSSTINNQKIIFFDGLTDSSGMINTISLPAPQLNLNNLEVPATIRYEIDAFFDNQVGKRSFYVNITADIRPILILSLNAHHQLFVLFMV